MSQHERGNLTYALDVEEKYDELDSYELQQRSVCCQLHLGLFVELKETDHCCDEGDDLDDLDLEDRRACQQSFFSGWHDSLAVRTHILAWLALFDFLQYTSKASVMHFATAPPNLTTQNCRMQAQMIYSTVNTTSRQHRSSQEIQGEETYTKPLRSIRRIIRLPPEYILPENPYGENPRLRLHQRKELVYRLQVRVDVPAKQQEKRSDNDGLVELVYGAEIDAFFVEGDAECAADGVNGDHEHDADGSWGVLLMYY